MEIVGLEEDKVLRTSESIFDTRSESCFGNGSMSILASEYVYIFPDHWNFLGWTLFSLL